jgi:large subunit ribosomal protein L10
VESLCQTTCEAKIFLLEGGERTLAITKQHKEELVSNYVNWLDKSEALIVTEYIGLNMKDIDTLRGKIRESGGEFHIVKNTLGKVAFEQAGLEIPENYLIGSTAIAFAFEDGPATAKALTDFAKDSDFVKVKGGYLDKQAISANEIKALADLPPLPVMRAQLLGVLMAPANKLARTVAEPARQIASVIKAYAEKDAAPETA